MFKPTRYFAAILPERLRAGFGRRATGFVLAMLLEGVLVLLLLTLGQPSAVRQGAEAILSSFNVKDVPEPAPAPADEPETQPAKRAAPPPSEPEKTEPKPPEPPPLPPIIPLSAKEMATVDIAAIPARPAPRPSPSQSTLGPPDSGAASDTPRVGGAGPNGEPLYAASWYHEPRHDELSGYLSTSRGPGWGLIACRTVPDYRVEDCVIVDEYPNGSNIARSVLAAAWQFRVRPPRIGGRPKIGEWVRIRIDYDVRRP